jgi:hypothetical protein
MHDSELTYQVVILYNSVMLGKKVYCGESVSSFSRHCWMLRVRSVVFSLSQTGLKSSWLTFFGLCTQLLFLALVTPIMHDFYNFDQSSLEYHHQFIGFLKVIFMCFYFRDLRDHVSISAFLHDFFSTCKF